ncbi:MAG: hypothetical protein Q8P07_02390 [bacterium]|nr:hypothetical protein [bacterium]
MIKGYGSRKDSKGKTIVFEGKKKIGFRWLEKDGSVDLGAPSEIVVKKGNQRDGGCNLFFSTQECSIGIKERFSLYLYGDKVSEVTLKIWGAYLRTEPQRAVRDLKKTIKDLEYLSITIK